MKNEPKITYTLGANQHPNLRHSHPIAKAMKLIPHIKPVKIAHLTALDLIQVTVQCPWCKSTQSIDLTPNEFTSVYETDTLIQDALPKHTADERELIKTGICPACWNKTFGPIN